MGGLRRPSWERRLSSPIWQHPFSLKEPEGESCLISRPSVCKLGMTGLKNTEEFYTLGHSNLDTVEIRVRVTGGFMVNLDMKMNHFFRDL